MAEEKKDATHIGREKEVVASFIGEQQKIYDTYIGNETNDQEAAPRRQADYEAAYLRSQTALYFEHMVGQLKRHGYDPEAPAVSDENPPQILSVTAREYWASLFEEEAKRRVKEQYGSQQLEPGQAASLYAQETRALVVAKLVELAPNTNIAALDARIDQQLSYATGQYSQLTPAQLQEVGIAAVNTQFADALAKAYEAAKEKPEAPFYSGHIAEDIGTPTHFDPQTQQNIRTPINIDDVRVYTDKNEARQFFEMLRSRNPDAMEYTDNPFENAGGKSIEIFGEEPTVVYWRDAQKNQHTAIFVSKEWALSHAGEGAYILPDTERRSHRPANGYDSKEAHDMHKLIANAADLGRAYATLNSDLVRHKDMEREVHTFYAETTAEQQAKLILAQPEDQRSASRSQLEQGLKKYAPLSDPDKFLKRVDNYLAKPEMLEAVLKAQEADQQRKLEEKSRAADPFATPDPQKAKKDVSEISVSSEEFGYLAVSGIPAASGGRART